MFAVLDLQQFTYFGILFPVHLYSADFCFKCSCFVRIIWPCVASVSSKCVFVTLLCTVLLITLWPDKSMPKNIPKQKCWLVVLFIATKLKWNKCWCPRGQVTYSDRCALVRLGGTRKQYGMCWVDGLCIWGLPLRKVATISCNSQWRSNCGKVAGVWSSFPMLGVTHLLRINCRYLLCW